MKVHALMSLEVDEDRLEAYRKSLDVQGALDLYPGEPREWRSMLDVVDLVNAEVIVSSEVLSLSEVDTGKTHVRESDSPWFRAGLVFGLLLVLALAVAFTDDLLRVLS